MSLASETVNNPAINSLIQSSLESEHYINLEWITFEEIIQLEPTQIDKVYYVDNTYCYESHENNAQRSIRKKGTVMLLCLGNNEECTPTFVSEFARIYSLPACKYKNDFRRYARYAIWLYCRGRLIKGFTKYDDNYYMVAHKRFYHCYSQYGFCSTCGRLRCSPVWCSCGRKQLSNGWTSNNELLDEFIKATQLRTNLPTESYLEWIPFDCVHVSPNGGSLYGLPVSDLVELTPLEITDDTDNSYYDKLRDEHSDINFTNVWVTIGFTYNTDEQAYCLISGSDVYDNKNGFCLSCTYQLEPTINAFCFSCKFPAPLEWTTGNTSLDSFIMTSWRNTMNIHDAYIQGIEYCLLTNLREMTSLRHGCTHMADWLDPTTNERMRVTLKKIDGQNIYAPHSFNSNQLMKKYPEILTPANIWIIGITQCPFTQEYYLVFYYDIPAILRRFILLNKDVHFMEYSDFYELNEVGSSSNGTIYAVKYRRYSEEEDMEETIALKRFKSIDKMPELFISEFRNIAKCTMQYDDNRRVYGVTQNPETNEYAIVMEHVNNGSLLSYLDQNVKGMSWRTKLSHLQEIADDLKLIHDEGIVHCDLHSGSIGYHDETPFICDFGRSRSVKSCKSNPNIRGVLPFIAPEVFLTRQFTYKSDIYSFGIIMHLMAAGEQPFRDREFDASLIHDIMNGLRPPMPDSAPEAYKKLAEECCDADPDMRPNSAKLCRSIFNIVLPLEYVI